MIFEISCSIFKNKIFFLLKFWGISDFWLKTLQNHKSCLKTAKIISLPYYLSHFIKKNPLFDIDLFSRTFDMESPIKHINIFRTFGKCIHMGLNWSQNSCDMTCEMSTWHLTCDKRHMTNGGRWPFSQNYRSLGHTVCN